MKVYDCFTFFNELDLLEIRLNYLDKEVDYFVLVEANKTHSGQDKPYYYEKNKERFKDFHHKIIHIKKELNTKGLKFEKSKTYNENDDYWKLENEQRNAITEGLKKTADEDIIIISDADEIPNIECIKQYKEKKEKNTIVLDQSFHRYYFNCKIPNIIWKGTIITKKNKINTPQELRNKRTNLPFLKKGGWHFSYLGNEETIMHKLKSFAHSEYNNEEYINKEKIKNIIKKETDLFNQNVKLKCYDIEHEECPEYILKNQKKFEKYIKTTKKITL